jgi:hypothetical protein
MRRVFQMLLATVCVPTLVAQSSDSRAWSVTMELQGSTAASRAEGWFGGAASGVTQQAIAARFSTPLLTLGYVRLVYAATFVPAVRLGGVEKATQVPGSGGRIVALQRPGAAWGAGVVPMQLGVDLPLGSRVRFETNAGVGAAWFSRPIPTFAARQRNFVLQWDAGVSLGLTRTSALALGLTSRHLSNGFTAYENLGLDNRLLVMGLRLRR